MRRVVAGALFMLAAAALLAPSKADAQTPPFDFSDLVKPQISWPFATVEFWIEEEEDGGGEILQRTHVSETPQQVEVTMRQLKSQGGMLSGYTVVGISPPTPGGRYNFILFKGSSRYRVNVRPDGSGSVITFVAVARSSPTGYFKRALYAYRIDGSDAEVRCERADNRDQ